MNARTMIVGALAVVCGLSAMVLVQALRKPGAPAVEKVSVVFAADDVKPGETITEAMVEAREVPKTEAPEDAILKPADAIGRAAMSQLDKGDLIRAKKLAERGAGRGMAALIKTGMRAITIPTPSFTSSMAGFLLPGNRVDVLLTTTSSGRSEDESGGATTTVLLQNAEILAVHTNVNAPTTNRIDPDQARSVTIQVTPDDANRLQLAQAKGTLSLSLRNLKDEGAADTRPANLSDIQVAGPRPEATPPAPQAPTPPEPPRPAPAAEELVDLARSIPKGMRAFTITTPSHSRSLVRTIHAGHRVDVLLTVNLKKDDSLAGGGQDEGEFRGVSSTILRDQEVLAIHPTLESGTTTASSSDEARAITLLVTPRDAELLDLAESAGKLHLALRPQGPGHDSFDESPPDPVTNADLLGTPKARDQPFPILTLEVRTLRGTAVGSNSMTYLVPRAPQAPAPPPKRAPASRPTPAPVPSRVSGPDRARADRPKASPAAYLGGVGGPSPTP